MALRQQSLPFIYGYQKALNTVVKDLKQTTKQQQDYVLNIVLNYESYVDLSKDSIKEIEKLKDQYSKFDLHELLLDAKSDKVKAIANQILIAINGWADPIQAELFTKIYENSINGYEIGYRDGTQKLINAIKKYKGQYESYVNKVIDALRGEEISIPSNIKSDLEQDKREKYFQ